MGPTRHVTAGVAAGIAVVGVATLTACTGGAGTSDAGADAGRDARRIDSGGDGAGDARGDAVEAGAPTLVRLEVAGAGVTSLVPAFSPGVHDYYVRCGWGANPFTVALEASLGADSVVLAPTPSQAAAAQRVAVAPKANDALVVAATDGAATTEYWIRCLP